MRIFEEELERSIFTKGPAQVLRIEARSELEDQGPSRRQRRRDYAVVIYQSKYAERPVPTQIGDRYVWADDAIETRFVQVTAEGDGGCVIPENAGRLLGHYLRDGRRWWVFLEKLELPSKRESPAPAAPRKSATESPHGSRAPAAAVSAPGKSSSPPVAPPAPRPGNTAKPEVR